MEDTFDDAAQHASSVNGLAVVSAALKVMSPDAFRAKLDAHLEAFQKEMAPLLLKERSSPTMGSQRMIEAVRPAGLTIGSWVYAIKVRSRRFQDEAKPSAPARGQSYVFMGWLDAEVVDFAQLGRDIPRLNACDVQRCPQDDPPEKSRLQPPGREVAGIRPPGTGEH